MWFYYNQNNSGGHFDFDKRNGISHHVLVEADSAEEANFKAESVGIYFGGSGDCPCCGDRWCPAMEGEGMDKPKVYGLDEVSPECKANPKDLGSWMQREGAEGFMHFKDGTFKPFFIYEKKKKGVAP